MSVAFAGCSSDNEVAGIDNPPGGSGALASSPALNELFASVRSRNESPTSSNSAKAALIESFNQFSLDTHRVLTTRAPADNAVVSGYSLASALSLVTAGTAGPSRAALNSLLHLDSIPAEQIDMAFNAVDLDLASRRNDDLELRTANRLFLREGERLQAQYLDNATGNYGAPITEADFRNNAPKVVEAINQWVSEQTNGLIDQLLNEIDPDTLLAVLNAVLLDATWQDEYTEAGDRNFTTLGGDSVSVPFFSLDDSLPVLQEAGFTAVEMPYAGGEISMLLVMPDDLSAFEQLLDATELNRITSSLQSRPVIYSLPEWRFEQTLDAKALLVPLGLPTGVLDFSVMLESDPGNLEITQVVQKAFIEVDKNGTRAAAATAVVVGTTSAPPDVEQPLILTLDRPYWYAIRDRITGTLLFSGRVVDPSQ